MALLKIQTSECVKEIKMPIGILKFIISSSIPFDCSIHIEGLRNGHFIHFQAGFAVLISVF